jgi:hypothetical protein
MDTLSPFRVISALVPSVSREEEKISSERASAEAEEVGAAAVPVS